MNRNSRRTGPRWVTAGAIVVAVVVGGLVSTADEVITEPSTGAEGMLAMINTELEMFIAGGMSMDDPVIKTLLETRAALEAAAGQPEPEPDPAVVAQMLAPHDPLPGWDPPGETLCEIWAGRHQPDAQKVIEEARTEIQRAGGTSRCALVTRPHGSALAIQLTDQGWALVLEMRQAYNEGEEPPVWREIIPVIPDFETVQIEVKDETLIITGTTANIEIPTTDWLRD